MGKTYLTVIILSQCLPFFASANDAYPSKQEAAIYSLSLHLGAMTPHYDLQATLNKDDIIGADMSAYFLNSSIPKFTSTTLGLGYFYSNLGNNDVYGYIHASYLGVMFPLLSKTVPVQLKLGLGPGYVTKKYDEKTNQQNQSIGSHLNAYGQISVAAQVPIVENRLMLRLGVSFNHVSNGLVVSPNQGINTVTVHTGLDFGHRGAHPGLMRVGPTVRSDAKRHFTVMLASGVKEVEEDKQIITSSLSFDYGYRLLPTFSAGIGLNLFHNDSWAYYPQYSSGGWDNPLPFQSSVHFALELDVSPLAIILQPGFYIYKPTDVIPNFTGRLGVRYSFSRSLSFQFAIKHHWFALADYFELGVGYRIYR